MEVQYDKDLQAVYLRLKDAETVDSEVSISKEIEPGVIYDYDESDTLIGIEILSVQKRPFEEIKRISSVLTEDQKEEFRNFFRQRPA